MGLELGSRRMLGGGMATIETDIALRQCFMMEKCVPFVKESMTNCHHLGC
jgi:hypothetical protein